MNDNLGRLVEQSRVLREQSELAVCRAEAVFVALHELRCELREHVARREHDLAWAREVVARAQRWDFPAR